MRRFTDEELRTYSQILCQQGFLEEEIIDDNPPHKFVVLGLTKKGNNYVNDFIKTKPSMFLLIYLDIVEFQQQLQTKNISQEVNN